MGRALLGGSLLSVLAIEDFYAYSRAAQPLAYAAARSLQYFNQLADKVDVEKIIYSTTTGRSSGSFKTESSTHDSQTENISTVKKYVLDAQLFHTLDSSQILALLSIEGHNMDDALNVLSVYVEA